MSHEDVHVTITVDDDISATLEEIQLAFDRILREIVVRGRLILRRKYQRPLFPSDGGRRRHGRRR